MNLDAKEFMDKLQQIKSRLKIESRTFAANLQPISQKLDYLSDVFHNHLIATERLKKEQAMRRELVRVIRELIPFARRWIERNESTHPGWSVLKVAENALIEAQKLEN